MSAPSSHGYRIVSKQAYADGDRDGPGRGRRPATRAAIQCGRDTARPMRVWLYAAVGYRVRGRKARQAAASGQLTLWG